MFNISEKRHTGLIKVRFVDIVNNRGYPLRIWVLCVAKMTYTVSSGTLNSTIPYRTMCSNIVRTRDGLGSVRFCTNFLRLCKS